MEKFNYYENIKEYNEIYQKEVMPILTGFEDERIKVKIKKTLLSIFFNIKFATLLFIVSIVCIIVSSNFHFSKPFDENMNADAFMSYINSLHVIDSITGGFIAFSMVYMAICLNVEIKKNNIENSFLSSIKLACLSKFLKIFGDIEWQIGGKPFITREEIFKSKIGNIYGGTGYQQIYADQFKGTYKNVAFKICEGGIYEDRGLLEKHNKIYILYEGNKKTNSTTVYKDIKSTESEIIFTIIILIVIFLIMAICISTTLIKSLIETINFNNAYERYFFIGITTIFIIPAIMIYAHISYLCIHPLLKEKDKKINLEDVKSEKKYVALSDDEIEGRYLLTPAFIERFNNLKILFEADEISCSFFEDKLMIAINTKKNLFEIGSVDKSLHDPTVLSNFFNEIYSICSIIDVLKLDERTGI